MELKVGSICPRCAGQMLPDAQDDDATACLQCGHVIYAEFPAPYETDRRSRTDNRQVTRPFDEYRKGMGDEEFDEAFKDIMEEGRS